MRRYAGIEDQHSKGIIDGIYGIASVGSLRFVTAGCILYIVVF
jgi:hypothetical protein